MKEVFFSVFTVFMFILICSAIAFNPLTVNLYAQVESLPDKAVLIQDGLDILNIMDLEARAIFMDLYLYLGWFPEDTEGLRQASFEAIDDIEDIKSRLSFTVLPKELSKAKERYAIFLIRFQDACTDVDLKNKQEKEEEVGLIRETRKEFFEMLAEIMETYIPEIDIPEDFHPDNEEIKLARDEKDQAAYRAILDLISTKRFQEAYDSLDKLQQKYQNTDFEKCILLRKTDCVLSADSPVESAEKEDMGEGSLQILEELANTDYYLPIIFESFYKWRTIYQSYNHGMSNMSNIPNAMYNEKRWELLQIVKSHLRQNPDDVWAKYQAHILLTLPNITRGGSFGNSNIIDWAHNYTSILDKKE